MPQRSLGQNFAPFNNYVLAATTSSQNTVVTQPSTTTGGKTCRDLYIYNSTAGVAFVAWGQTSQTASTSTSFAVAPGAVMVIDMGDNPVTNIGIILGTSSGNVYFSIGNGT